MLEFLDLTREMVDAEGQPIKQLYDKDGLNLNSIGYARWSGALLAVLERMF
jgi:lysophospholipase L1-like esterase